LPVELRDLKALDVDALEAADVDGDHLGAVGTGARAEGADAAGLAEEVMHRLLAELIVGDVPLAGEELELALGDEGEDRARADADRAVAADGRREVRPDLVA